MAIDDGGRWPAVLLAQFYVWKLTGARWRLASASVSVVVDRDIACFYLMCAYIGVGECTFQFDCIVAKCFAAFLFSVPLKTRRCASCVRVRATALSLCSIMLRVPPQSRPVSVCNVRAHVTHKVRSSSLHLQHTHTHTRRWRRLVLAVNCALC